jgi:hypothetical protein
MQFVAWKDGRMQKLWFRTSIWHSVLVVVLVVMLVAAPASVLYAQDTSAPDIPDVQGQWDATLQVTAGPGAALTDTCSTAVIQNGINLTGNGACAAVGAGDCTGTVLAALALMRLVCSSPVQGTRTVLATISEDGTTATGTWTASNGSSGSYQATRQVASADQPGDTTADPDSDLVLIP